MSKTKKFPTVPIVWLEAPEAVVMEIGPLKIQFAAANPDAELKFADAPRRHHESNLDLRKLIFARLSGGRAMMNELENKLPNRD